MEKHAWKKRGRFGYAFQLDPYSTQPYPGWTEEDDFSILVRFNSVYTGAFQIWNAYIYRMGLMLTTLYSRHCIVHT